MTDPSSIAIINLVAGILVFFAAIIPISFKVWKKAKETNSTFKLKIILTGICSIILYATGLILGWIIGPSLPVFYLTSGGFAFFLLFFYIQDGPIERKSIVLLFLQSMVVTMALILHYVKTYTEILAKIVNG